jgi:uncharacterized protein YidB (DUF937 family)
VSDLQGLLGTSTSPMLLSTIRRILDEHGGIKGLVDQFEKQGLGEIAGSWVSAGPNRPITAVQMYDALGAANVLDMAARGGWPVPELVHKLTAYLPLAIDKLTPGGVIPDP